MRKKSKFGRPPRQIPLEKLNLLIDRTVKRRAYEIASHRGFSVGRLIEYLILNVDDSDPFPPRISLVERKVKQ